MTKAANTHETYQEHTPSNTSTDRTFGLVFVAAFTIIAVLPVLRRGEIRRWALVVAVVLLLFALFIPVLLAPLNRVWLVFGLLLHRIASPIMMGLMFYVILTPVATVMRLGRRDALKLRSKGTDGTAWVDRAPPGPQGKTMRNQY